MHRYLFVLALSCFSVLGYAQQECSEIYRDGEWETAKKVCESAAKLGSPQDMYYLANVYGRKNTLPENELNRISWYTKAAEAGHYESQRALAYHYSFRKKNRVNAEYFLLMSAIHPDADEIALNSTGRFYRIANRDVKGNEALLQERWSESFRWHKQAADLGSTYGQIKVGDLYKDGMGVEQNWKAAIEWYLKAATHGDEHAYFRLGYLYLYGVKNEGEVILEKDLAKAYGYLKFAAEKWGKFSHVDLGYFDAFISNPFIKLPAKETLGKRHRNPKDDIKQLDLILKQNWRESGDKIYESLASGEFDL